MSRFTIVLFDDGLQLVPSLWIFDDETMCHWPPFTNEKKLRKAIINEISPDNSTWTSYKILRIFGTANTYESGMEKVKLAQDYSDLDLSEKENNLRQKRISRPNKQFTNYNNSSDESNENNKNNVNVRNDTISKHQEANKTLPVPVLPKTLIVTKPSKRNEMQSVEFNNPSSNRNLIKEPSVTYLDTAGKNVLPEILRRLNQIFTKLNLIDDRLCEIEANQINNTTKKEASILEEFVALPLKTHKQVQNMEKDLENQDFFEKMAISLNKIGGRDSRELIINILKRSITNEIAKQYSWAGKLKKMGFKDLLLAKCIMRAVRITDGTITEKEMIAYMSKWLVQATLRYARSVEPKKT
ncbi:uncharacterized protein LOC143903253 [Temnothorax americanus]|uniref:uncharacterized protein LOC143903253 n=1 Tax=Temnothorax americanus TaxID=1964332 RepID=UPI004069014D